MTRLSDASSAYQQALEALRFVHPLEHDKREELEEDLAKARRELEIAWIANAY